MLSKLYRYINSDPTPSDASSVRCTLAYLEACNQLFEKDFSKSVKYYNPLNKDMCTSRSGTMTFTVSKCSVMS